MNVLKSFRISRRKNFQVKRNWLALLLKEGWGGFFQGWKIAITGNN